MQVEPLSNDVRTFLFERVQTYEQLDTLLLLYRESGEWSATTVANSLGIDAESARSALTELENSELLSSSSGNYRFAAKTKALEECTAALSVAYEQSRLAVISAMSKNALTRVRTSGVRMFSAAFRLRGKE